MPSPSSNEEVPSTPPRHEAPSHQNPIVTPSTATQEPSCWFVIDNNNKFIITSDQDELIEAIRSTPSAVIHHFDSRAEAQAMCNEMMESINLQKNATKASIPVKSEKKEEDAKNSVILDVSSDNDCDENLKKTTIDVDAVKSQLKPDKFKGKSVLHFLVSPIAQNDQGQKTAVVSFRFLNTGGYDHWIFKPDFNQETLEILKLEAPRSYLSVFPSIKKCQICSFPFGPNVAKATTSKRNGVNVEYPVYMSYLVLSVGKGLLDPKHEIDLFAKKVKKILESNLYKKLYMQVVSAYGSVKMICPLEDQNNVFWSSLRDCELDIQHDVPLNHSFLDEDIVSIMSSLYSQTEINNWSDDMKMVAFRDGHVSGDLL